MNILGSRPSPAPMVKIWVFLFGEGWGGLVSEITEQQRLIEINVICYKIDLCFRLENRLIRKNKGRICLHL